MPDDLRVQGWRERQRIVAKMVDSAFNGDAPDETQLLKFALLVRAPNGDVSMIKNIEDHDLFAAFLRIIAMSGEMADMDLDDDGPPAGHA